MPEAVIVDAVRTPIGRAFKGSLKDVRADELAAVPLRALVERNPFGGAIALGHPFGMTGARIMTTLLNDLETLDGTYGIESVCVAGGMGQAMLVERVN
jgi:acetyl-CoA acetyltransferase